MEQLYIEPGFLNYLDVFYAGSLLRSLMYMIPAFLTYLVAWKIYRKKFQTKRIVKKEVSSTQLWFEMRHSIQTTLIWGVLSIIHVYGMYKGYAKVYYDINEHSTTYYLFSIILVILVHDTYFYWTHRMMHHPKLYKMFHTTHHKSNNPSPWAIFSFQPAEALVQFGITFILVFGFPCHISVHVIWTVWLLAFNLLGHLGYEFFPKGFTTNPATSWMNSSTHHAMHHKFVTSNYGLYFTFWDRIMGTLHAKYHDTFASIKDGNKI